MYIEKQVNRIFFKLHTKNMFLQTIILKSKDYNKKEVSDKIIQK